MNTLETDVLVCGGGCAGLAAALAAARNHARVLLVERAGFAGGIVTTVGLPYFDGLVDKKTNKIVLRGIPLEFLNRLGIVAPDAETVPKFHVLVDSIERFKLLADRMLAEQSPRLSVLYHAMACGAEVVADRIDRVLVASKDGLTAVRAKVIVDGTGDADIACWAGAPVTKSPSLQPMTMHFRIGNVNRQPDLSAKCRDALVRAHEAGELPLFYGPGLMFHFAPDEVYVHATRVAGDASDPGQLTAAEMQGRRDVWTMFERWKKEVPGFEDAYLIETGPYIGVRETRRIVGRYVLTEDDIKAEKPFDDAVATGCWYLDLHPQAATPGSAQKEKGHQPGPYDIPYRSLLPQQITNLIVAGRCHSATQWAASSTRVTATAMAMGQAAGVAGALAVERNVAPAELDGRLVRQTLHQQHAGPYLRS
ncbi:MAG: FAD-dependent oxidoreductase [Isosphaeraceae bacterium]|nr:FAD-dependent oxidoreductase [Isosphaeraceae bacterium]